MHAANRRIYGQWTSAIPSRFIAELPQDHVDGDTTMSGGGASPWRSQFTERAAPFTDIGRGPGWQRAAAGGGFSRGNRSEEPTSELQSLMRISYAVFCLKKKIYTIQNK